MADGLNDARALRIQEIMTDFRAIAQRITTLRADAPAGQAQAIGYAILRQCQAEIQAVLSSHFDSGPNPSNTSNPEGTKKSLQRIIIDAASRRFRAQKILLKASAAMRWVQQRRTILNGQNPGPQHQAQLQMCDNTLRAEIATITDSRVFNELRTKDQAAGHWIAEMPDLASLLAYIRTH